ncbi:hypothetical protein GBA65_20245 [Rubrobacter marinus]|uniref:Bacterial Ig-like domain-containing protein n=1 Tax=Rubrobacter marinus TaxID=2653852 RepID=A0A6G8Q1W5_9ACTN|nr:hypothetical protein [Rubrobacter marinus]QIN80459.1 hypothetical protein GBA65_20245 [Rubrobacter marinus]
MRPTPGSRTFDRTPVVRATVRDAQTNLAKGNIRLFVDGRAVKTFSYDRATDRLSYTSGRLSYATHRVRMVATDARGAATSKTWAFRVARR